MSKPRFTVGPASQPATAVPRSYRDLHASPHEGRGNPRNAATRTRNAEVYDPATTRFDPSISNYVRDAFPNNIIPPSRIDPLARKIGELALSTFKPLRTDVVPGTPQYWLENYWQSGTSVNPNNKASVKFDHVLSDTHRISAYIGYSKRESVPGPSGPPGIPGLWNPFLNLSDTAPVYPGQSRRAGGGLISFVSRSMGAGAGTPVA